MRKIVLAVLVLFSASTVSYSQAYEDKVEYNKTKQACLTIEYNFPAAAVENAWVARMDKMGYKGKEEKGMFNKDKGFRIYKGTLISDISPTRYDYVVNVEKKSRKSDDEAVLYLIIMRDGNNALSSLSSEELSRARKYLGDLLPDIEEANLELQITAQEEVVTRAEKQLRNLQNDKEDMEKKIKKLQEDIKDNEKEQEKQAAEIENQKKGLDALRAKRKKSA